MSWHYLQEQEAESWEENSLDGAPCSLLKLIPTVAVCCSPDSATECLNPSRSGTTCRRLTEANGEDTLMSLAEDSHARTLAQPGKVQELTGSGLGCGWSLPGSFAKYDHDLRLWKTRQCSLLGDSEEFLETWPRWASMRDGECLELIGLEPPCTASESGYWQTPTTRDGKGQSGKGNREKRGRNGKLHVANLCDQIVDLGRPDLVRCIALRYRLMQWPEGWTDLKPLEMDRFRVWQQAHGIS